MLAPCSEGSNEHGIENILALGGDLPQGMTDWQPHPDGFHYAIELVREAIVDAVFRWPWRGFPEVHPRAVSREADLRFLKEKVDAGADAIITQLFFDNQVFFPLQRRSAKARRDCADYSRYFAAAISAAGAPFHRALRFEDPGEAGSELVQVENDDDAAVELGIEYATRQCEELIKFGVSGLHFYTLNKSYSLLAIHRNLGL